MPRFDDPELHELPVVTPDSQRSLIGCVRHHDIIVSIGSEVLGPQRRSTRIPVVGRDLPLPAGHRLATVPVPDAWVGRAIDALPPSERGDLVIVLELRGKEGAEEIVAATPEHVLREGSRIVVIGSNAALRRLRSAGFQP